MACLIPGLFNCWRTGPVRVLSGTRPVKSWPDPVLSGSVRGLSDAWPGLVRSGLTWSNFVWYDPVLGLSGYGLSDT